MAQKTWYLIYPFPTPSLNAAASCTNIFHSEGPIVRIGPNELHIADPSFYATAFAMGYKYLLRYEHYKFANVGEDCQVGLRDIAEHKRRRQVFNPLFSKASINKLDHRIRKYIDNAVSWIDKQSTTGEGIKIGKLFRGLTVDIISEYAYADSMNTVARGDLDTPFISGMKTAMPMMWFFGFFWPIQEFMNAVPFKVLQKILPRDMLGMLEMQNVGSLPIDGPPDEIRAAEVTGKSKEKNKARCRINGLT